MNSNVLSMDFFKWEVRANEEPHPELDADCKQRQHQVTVRNRAPIEYRKQRAHNLASVAMRDPLNASDPFTYGRVYAHAMQGIC